jgi:hypothetical protein
MPLTQQERCRDRGLGPAFSTACWYESLDDQAEIRPKGAARMTVPQPLEATLTRDWTVALESSDKPLRQASTAPRHHGPLPSRVMPCA